MALDAERGYVSQGTTDPAPAFEHAAATGCDYLELLADGPTAYHDLDAARLRELQHTHGMDLLVHLPWGGFDLGSPYDRIREAAVAELREAIAFVGDADGRKVVVHAATKAWVPVWEDDPLTERICDSLDELASFGEEVGVEVCAENVNSGPIDTADFDRVLSETGVSMTLDTGHARMHGFDAAGMGNLVAEYPNRVSHLHLILPAVSPSRISALRGAEYLEIVTAGSINDTRVPRDEHLPFGAGTIDFRELFERLSAVDWSGTLSVEVFTFDDEYIAVSVERLDRLLDDVEG